MKTRRAIIMAVLGLTQVCVTSFAQSTNQQINALCRDFVRAVVQDITSIRTTFPELANFDPSSPVVSGNVLPLETQHQDLRISYFNNYEYVKGPDKRQGHYRLKPGGCILNIQLFPNGGSWAGFLVGPEIRNIDERLERTGIRLQASIQTQNNGLADKLEEIIQNRFSTLKQYGEPAGEPYSRP